MNLEFPPGDEHFSQRDWAEYQLTQYRELVKRSPHRKLALDVGAHCGIMTRRMAVDYESVVAFEPVHTWFLENNTQEFDNVTVHQCALTDTTGGSVPMTMNLKNSGDNRIGVEAGNQYITVEQRTIDSFNLEAVGAIKMDIQGSEYAALRGAERTITRDHPALMLEIETWDTNRNAILAVLKSWGYRRVFSRNADNIFIVG